MRGATTGIAALIGMASGSAFAGDMAMLRGAYPGFEQSTGAIEAEFGARAWYSTGRLQKRLYGSHAATSGMVSRLTYDRLDSWAGEVFGRVATEGYFLKGLAGAGWLDAGKLQDEDFPPLIDPYSSTDSAQTDGTLTYAVLDIGRDLVSGHGGRLGAFVGYAYLNSEMNAFGCTQTATNTHICPTGAVLPGTLGITEDATFHAARLGLSASFEPVEGLSLVLDGAWLPYVMLDGTDTHWLRPDLTPIPEDGRGTGYQLEALASYAVTPSLSIGAGGRYWHMATKGNATFHDVWKQPVQFETERYGAFLQSSYRLWTY